MQQSDSCGTPDRRCTLELLVVSIFLLYLEMMLIRWISTEIRIFAYFKNLTLIACFLGMGLGCVLARRRHPGFVVTYPSLALFTALLLVPRRMGFDVYALVTNLLGSFNEMPLWIGTTGAVGILGTFGALGLLVGLFALISLLFVPGGRLLGELFDRSPNLILGYSVNIAGSLVGIWLFSVVSFLALPPVVWFATALLVGCPLLRSPRQWLVAGLSVLVMVGLFTLLPAEPGRVVWSPYQKLRVQPLSATKPDGSRVSTGYLVTTNESQFQAAVNYAPSFLRQHEDLWPEARNVDFLGYNLVYRIQPSPANVLIVGAGTGNDVAAGLRNGARHVDAVEIDPCIVEIGRALHPEHPYDDPRVSVIIDDARSFFKRAPRKYDLIVFGALDSHTLSSSMSNIRIDNYVYTVESFREARDLLTDNGVLCLTFAVERPFIGRRLYGMLEEAFGSRPVVFAKQQIRHVTGAGGGPTFLIDRGNRIEERIRDNPAVSSIVASGHLTYAGDVPLGFDDWPYLYLEGKMIPRLYTTVMAVLLLLTLLAVRPLLGELKRLNPHFFFLGAAFLLVEVQSISKMALLFGTTWIVNSIVISAVLIMILLSNLIAARVRFRSLTPLYVALAASLTLNVVFPFHLLLLLGPAVRGAVAGGVMGLPVLFAGLVFILTFARAPDPDVALGSNLLGAIAGGACECLSFIIGLNALGLVALAFYVCSLATLWRRRGLALTG